MKIILSLAVLPLGLLFWYIFYGLEVWINGGVSIFRCLKEEIMWFLPGGNRLKGEYIKKMMENFKDGWIGDYSYTFIRENNFYIEIGKKELPGRLHFLFMHIFFPLLPSICIYQIMALLGY